MPFIQPFINPYHTCKTFVIRGSTNHVGVSFITHYLAQKAISDGKKVLIFDTLLGLKNYPIQQNSADITYQVLNGQRPLTDIIIHQDGTDVIAQISNTNLNACSHQIQNYIKDQLDTLKQNYDLLLIDASANVPNSLFIQDQNTIWVTTPDTTQILKTLQLANNETNPQIVLNKIQNPVQQNQATLLIKQLCPTAHITDNIPLQKG